MISGAAGTLRAFRSRPIPAREFTLDYTAACPACGADTTWTAVHRTVEVENSVGLLREQTTLTVDCPCDPAEQVA